MFTRAAAILALAFVAAWHPPTAEAAPLGQACQANAFRQHDMAGRYASDAIMLEIYPCGGSTIAWSNAYGTHAASYYGAIRLPGGGIGARGIRPDTITGGWPDDAEVIGFKPAEPGYIQVFTVDRFGNVVGVYRLRKLS